MSRLIDFEELSDRTELSKYRLRAYQKQGYFCPEEDQSGDGRVYDTRWVTFWDEATEYGAAGLAEYEALKEAYADVFEGRG